MTTPISGVPPVDLHPFSRRSHGEATSVSLAVPTRASVVSGEPMAVLVSVQASDLRSFLDSRGMEIGFVLDRLAGVSRMVIVDPLSGRTVLEIPAQSPLESVVKEMLASRP